MPSLLTLTPQRQNIWAVLVALLAPWSGHATELALPIHLDFGPPGSAVQAGYQRAGAEPWQPELGHGWEGTLPSVIRFEAPPPAAQPHHRSEALVFEEVGDALKIDAAVSTEDLVYRVDLPKGAYRVTLSIGDLRQTLGSIDVSFNGEQVAENVAAWAPRHRTLIRNTLGWWTEVRRTVQVTDGILRIRLTRNESYLRAEMVRQEQVEKAWAEKFPYSNNVNIYSRVGLREAPYIYAGFPFQHHALMGLTIEPNRPPPVVGAAGSLRLTQPVGSPALLRAIEAFNSGNPRSAAAALEEVTEPRAQVARALVQLWLVGHIDLEPFEALLGSALEILRPYVAANPEQNGVAEILRDAETFAHALEIHRKRGHITFGEGHFGQNSRAIGFWWLIPEESPVYDRARLYIARAAHMQVPYLPTRGTERDIFEKLQRKYPDNRFVRYQLTQEWENFGDGSVYYDWVWKDYAAEIKGAPPWAEALYPAFQNFVDWCEWWFRFRMDDKGSLGGGWGDDVEVIAAMAYTSHISPDISSLLNAGTQKFLHGLWNYSEIDPELGFYQPLWDAEHSAEWTGNTLGMALQVDYGNPVWIERAMKTGKLMRDIWTDFDDQGLRRFRANYFGAATVGQLRGHQYDSWINYRAIRPAKAVVWYNQNPAIARVLIELADGWLAVAMSTERGKPRGVIPHNVGFPNGIIGGHDTDHWWDSPPTGGEITNRPWEEQAYKEYIYDLLFTAYGLTGDSKYLEPVRLEYELAVKHGFGPVSSTAARLQPTPGDERVASEAEQAAAKRVAAARARRQALAQQRGKAADGRSGPVAPELDVPEEADLGSESWVAANLGGVKAWLTARRRIEGRKGPLENDVTVEDIVKKARYASAEGRMRYPLMTTEAGPTDRLGFHGWINPLMIYAGARAGGPSLECEVTYRNTTRNFVAAVLGGDPQGLRILYYSLAPAARTIGLVPWNLEPKGRYKLRYGPDRNDDQVADEIIEERVFEFPQRGTEVPLFVEPRVAYVIEIEQMERGGLPSLTYDPGISSHDIRYAPYAKQILVRVHNLGSKAVREVEVAAYDGDPASGGTLIGLAVIPNLEAPVNLEPATTTIGFEWSPTRATHPIHVVIDPRDRLGQEITTFNNHAWVSVAKPERVSLSDRGD